MPVSTRTARTCVSLKSFEVSYTPLWSAGACSRFSVSTDFFTRSVIHGRKKSGVKPPHSKATQSSSKPVLNKQHILRRITEVAKKLGHTPSILEFTAQVEISRYSLFRLFPKWNEALRAAGLKPNRLYVRPEDNELLKDWGEAVRKKRRHQTSER